MEYKQQAVVMSENDYGYIRVAAAVPRVNVADVATNVAGIVEGIEQAQAKQAQLVVFPEMCITGYTCADLFGNELLLDEAEHALVTIAQAVARTDIIAVVGAPLRCSGHLYNCAVVMQHDKMWVVPKTYIPNYKEFYEKRWFTSANITRSKTWITVNGREVPFGTDMIFDAGRVKIAVEVCEDVWVPIPPSSVAALNGANVIVNLSASNEVVGKHTYLVDLIKHQSDHCIAAYVYASAGYGESTTDLVFTGNAIIAENGTILREGKRFTMEPQIEVADIDIELLENERRVNGSFSDNLLQFSREYRRMAVDVRALNYDVVPCERKYRRLPFVPEGVEMLNRRCQDIIDIQTEGLVRRMSHIHARTAVIGLSGGLDSTLALLVAVNAFDRLGLDRSGLYGITMPGFGTTSRTRNNAVELMKLMGVTSLEISIAAAVNQHFKDIDHDPSVHDVTYENSQARERTQILMDYANKVNGLVLGTGDLSELALGWATYNGDHMSMYNVNVSIPKTLVRSLVSWFATSHNDGSKTGKAIAKTLLDIVDTPISPELTPADSQGRIQQVTEDLIGPYELHDFFLYNMLRHGFAPRKLYYIARQAFAGDYKASEIKHWLTVFSRRFFNNQFKRSCLPDGPKVGNISLSPRGDWRMPSDASSALWLRQCESLPD